MTFEGLSNAEVCKSCRSRQELSKNRHRYGQERAADTSLPTPQGRKYRSGNLLVPPRGLEALVLVGPLRMHHATMAFLIPDDDLIRLMSSATVAWNNIFSRNFRKLVPGYIDAFLFLRSNTRWNDESAWRDPSD